MYELSDTSIMLKQCHSESETLLNHLNSKKTERLDLTKHKKWIIDEKQNQKNIRSKKYIYAHFITDLWPVLLPTDNKKKG